MSTNSRRHKLPPAGQALTELHPSGSVYRTGSRISEQGVQMYIDVGVRFIDFIYFFLNIP